MDVNILNARVAEIRNNYETVLERIHLAANRAGHSADHIRVVVVSKTQPIEVIQCAVQAGIRIFGENYPEETAPKISAINNPLLEWHMIGHLQSRKAKIVAEHFQWFHAMDSLKLASRLNKQLEARNKKMPVLMEFNVGGEDSKAGWLANQSDDWPQLVEIVEQVAEFPFLDIRGLMTMPPLETETEMSREYFIKLRKLRDFLEQRLPHVRLPELSMGTSLDYEAAVQEGATMVRIGTAILGSRPAQ